MGLFNFFRGSARNKEHKELMKRGAVIMDVRSPIEFMGSHIRGAVNIPLPEIEFRIKEIKRFKKGIIICGADNTQTSKAVRILKSKRIASENGGEWQKLEKLIQS